MPQLDNAFSLALQGMGIVFVLMLSIIVVLRLIRAIAFWLEGRTATSSAITANASLTTIPPASATIDQRTRVVITAAMQAHLRH